MNNVIQTPKRIVSASYREDIPAFGTADFYAAVKRGYAVVKTKIGDAKVSLRPENVYCYVFWTKNPSEEFISRLNELQNPYYFQWTITGYGKDIEPNLPSHEERWEKFRRLVDIAGPGRVIWRYDPIFISNKYTLDYHKAEFERSCQALQGYTQKCVISFMDEYGKIADLVRKGVMRAPSDAEVMDISEFIGRTAAQYGIAVQTCSEMGYDLTAFGIREAPCVDAEFIEKEFGLALPASVKKPGSFRRCLCAVNTDIGHYHQCKHGCLYCYAK